MKVLYVLLLNLLGCSLVFSHSWIACTKYSEENGVLFDEAKCAGFPRNWETYNGGGFGVDRGYNFNGGGCGPQNARGSPNVESAYSTRYPMAEYEVGERICLAWPAKNHVAVTSDRIYPGVPGQCRNPTNQFIPDTELKLFYSSVNPSQDPPQSQFRANEITPFGRGTHTRNQVDFQGFQNCPNFCENNDKALCTGCFTVPNLTPGIYSFQWYWIFNEGSTPYTTCFDARVVPANGGSCNGVNCGTFGTCRNGACVCRDGYSGVNCQTPPQNPPSTTTGTSTGGTSGTPRPPLGLDSIRRLNFPSQIPQSGSFDCVLQYNSAGNRAIIIDLLESTNFGFFGKGDRFVSQGEGEITITIDVRNNPTRGSNYILKGWIVEDNIYRSQDTPWAYELDKIEIQVTVGDRLVYPEGAPNTPSDPSSSSTNLVNAILAISLLLFLLF